MSADATNTPPRRFAHVPYLVGAAVLSAVVATSCHGVYGFGADGIDGGAGGSAGGSAASITGSPSVGRSVRRLSQREYDNVVHDLLGDTTQPASALGLDVYTNGYDNGSDGLIIQGNDVLAYQAVAETLAATAVTSNMSLLIGSCDPQASADTCVDAFFASFPTRAYRRPPTDTELQRLRTVYAIGAANGGFTAGIQLSLEAILQSPAFLYREELGAPDPSLPASTVRMTDYEVASELSFLITGSMPDAELMAAAAGGTLHAESDFQREATRLLTSAGAKPALRSFLNQWMATDQVASLDKDPTVYPTFTPGVATSMAGELAQYFDQVLWTGTGSLRELFTSTQSFIDPTLASTIYGVTVPGTGFQPVTLDAQTRQGILTRAGFLATHADVDSSGPIPRGVFVLSSLFCEPPGSPPPNVPPAPPVSVATAAHETTRQRFDAHLNESFCQDCHTSIDGVGFGFEQFDGMGVYRTTENGLTVDTSGTLVGTDVDGPFVGASQLAADVVKSRKAMECFIKQLYRYSMGQEESAAAQPVLATLGTGFTADSRVTDVLEALVADPSFVLRSTLQTSP
jgi:uncharacterized protein DUF1592/uncharacterized protein DUF1588/uncharacterized protein DUF1595/uncharacterized protein DUF1587